jgi:hypothetical protein
MRGDGSGVLYCELLRSAGNPSANPLGFLLDALPNSRAHASERFTA